VEKAKRGLASAGCQRMRNGGKQAVHADSLDEQRNRYAQIKQAWDNKQMDTVQALMPTQGLSAVSVSGVSPDYGRSHEATVTVNNFIQANPTLPPPGIQSRFVNELARREDWRGLLAFSPEKPPPKRSVTTTQNGRPASRKRPGPGRKSSG
jgi:soluble lytic murein transglycosylase